MTRRDVELLKVEDRQHVVQDLVVVRDRLRLVLCLSLLASLHPLEELVRVDASLLVLRRHRYQPLDSDEGGFDSVPIHFFHPA